MGGFVGVAGEGEGKVDGVRRGAGLVFAGSWAWERWVKGLPPPGIGWVVVSAAMAPRPRSLKALRAAVQNMARFCQIQSRSESRSLRAQFGGANKCYSSASRTSKSVNSSSHDA